MLPFHLGFRNAQFAALGGECLYPVGGSLFSSDGCVFLDQTLFCGLVQNRTIHTEGVG